LHEVNKTEVIKQSKTGNPGGYPELDMMLKGVGKDQPKPPKKETKKKPEQVKVGVS